MTKMVFFFILGPYYTVETIFDGKDNFSFKYGFVLFCVKKSTLHRTPRVVKKTNFNFTAPVNCGICRGEKPYNKTHHVDSDSIDFTVDDLNKKQKRKNNICKHCKDKLHINNITKIMKEIK